MANNIVIKISSDMSGSGVTANQNTTTGGQKPQQTAPNKAGELSVTNDLTKVLSSNQSDKPKNLIDAAFKLEGNTIEDDQTIVVISVIKN